MIRCVNKFMQIAALDSRFSLTFLRLSLNFLVSFFFHEKECDKSSEHRLLTFNVLTPSSSALSRRGTFKATTIFLLISFYYSPRRPNHVRTFVTLENSGGLKGGNPTDDESNSQHSLLRHSHSRMKFSVVLLVHVHRSIVNRAWAVYSLQWTWLHKRRRLISLRIISTDDDKINFYITIQIK